MGRSKLLVAFLLFASLFSSKTTFAHGYGFPPYGAWAYGSGPSYVARTRSVYRPYWGRLSNDNSSPLWIRILWSPLAKLAVPCGRNVSNT